MTPVYLCSSRFQIALTGNSIQLLQAAESEECASFKAAMDVGHPVRIEANQSLTLADGKQIL